MIATPLLILLVATLQPAPTGTAVPEPAASGEPSVPATPASPASPEASIPASSEPSAAASPAPSPAESLQPQSTSAPTVVPTPTIPPTERPTSPPYAYRFVPRQPEHVPAGQPQIFAVYLNSNKLKSLGPIDIKVSTSPDVVKVMTVSNGRENAIPMIAPGDFEASSKLPKLPFIASGVTTVLNFVAIGASGKRVSVPVPVTLQ